MSHFNKQLVPLCLAIASFAGSSALIRADLLDAYEAPLQAVVGVESGWVTADSPELSVIFSHDVTVPNAAWIRLDLAGTLLGGDESLGAGAMLRMTSLTDGGMQSMRASHLDQWGYHSAYFNGDTVRVELVSTSADGASRVVINSAIHALMPTGETQAGGDASPRTYCDVFDNRELSTDPRVARILYATGSVATAFIIDDPNHTFLTNGPAASALLASSVIEFNAPLTFPNGTTLNHPPPEDQYVADLSSVQFASGATGSGNSWGYFGAFPNSTTGETPFQRQNAFFQLADVVPAADGRMIRAFGNGFTQPPIFRTWSFVQKTEVAPYTAFDGTRIFFRADLTSGDAGAPIIDETTGQVIGIASEDGCTTTGGANAGTPITNANLRAALNHPQGVSVALVYSYPFGIPELINPNGGTIVRVEVNGANGAEPQPGTGLFHYNANMGGGWITVPMSEISPNIYEAEFPGFDCGAFVDYYFSAETSTGIRVPDQINNPVSTFRSASATSVTTIADLNFEDGTGWFIDGVAVTAGAWELAIPTGNGSQGDPTTDFDGSGRCYLTGNQTGNVSNDLDGGPTRLRSPTYNLSAASHPYVSYAYWFTNQPVDIDRLNVQISNNNGLSYTTFHTVPHSNGWNVARFEISDLLPLTSGVRFRFAATDNPNNSRTEAAIDAFSIIDYHCDFTVCAPGDMDENGVVDARDIAGFVSVMVNGAPQGSLGFCAADVDNNGELSAAGDLAAFVNCLINGACP